MTAPRRIILSVLLLCIAMSMQANPTDSLAYQKSNTIWRGEASIEGGSNFHLSPLKKKTHNLGGFKGKVGFTKKRFDLDLSTSIYYEHQITGKAGGNIRVLDGDSTKKADVSVNERSRLNTQSSLSLSWKPGKNSFKTYYTFSTNKENPNNYNLSASNVGTRQFDLEYSIETGSKISYLHLAGISFERPFPKPARKLIISYDAELYSFDDYSEWATGILSQSTEKTRYSTTSNSKHNDSKLIALYSDKNLFSVKNLEADFSVTVQFRNLNELTSAANYIGQEWRDSASVREKFRYRTLSLSPAARMRYKTGIYRLDIIYSPEYFAYRLDGNNQSGNINKGRMANLAEMTHTFNFNSSHTLSAHFKRYDDRPGYLQLCWFPRVSTTYANEIYQGNPDLQNSITTKTRVSYNYTFKRFSTTIEMLDVFKPRQIARVYNNEVIDGKEYRVYTWINGGKSNEIGTNLTLSWKGKHFAMSVTGKYNYYKGISASGSETKSSDYSVSSHLSFQHKTWLIEGNAKYQSGMNRSYYSISSLIDGNIKLSKSFGNHWSMFLFGQNLLDHPVVIKTTSEDETEIRYEKNINYKRFVRLGITYKF